MYLPTAHAEHDISLLRQFIQSNPLGIVITALQSSQFPTLQCTHVPWVLDVADASSKTELGKLRGHMARANPHTKAMIEAIRQHDSSNGFLEAEVTVLFNGPAHAYVTPKFYVETKPTTGKVVPTWNYSAVQAYGRAKILFDSHNAETGSYLQKQVGDLSQYAEEQIMNYTGGVNPSAWELNDAPIKYVELLKKAIIGIEIEITRLEGKFKMSQEMGEGDRRGVVEGFRALGTDNSRRIASTVEERTARKAGLASQ